MTMGRNEERIQASCPRVQVRMFFEFAELQLETLAAFRFSPGGKIDFGLFFRGRIQAED